MDRRDFLTKGLIGGAIIHFSSLIWSDLRVYAASSEATNDKPSELFLNLSESAILLRFIDSILGDLEKHHHCQKEKINEKTFANFNVAASKLAPHAQKDLKLLFKILNLRPTRLLLTGYWKPLPDLHRKDVDKILESWSRSGIAIRRSAYDGLRDLILASWYGDQASWSMINFPGIPQL